MSHDVGAGKPGTVFFLGSGAGRSYTDPLCASPPGVAVVAVPTAM
jgi:hypothetical protein